VKGPSEHDDDEGVRKEEAAPTSVPLTEDDRVVPPDAAAFGDHVAATLAEVVGADLVGVYFVGSLVLGGYVPGESDIDIVAVTGSGLSPQQKRAVASAIVAASAACPARGLEFTLYRRGVVSSAAEGADFEVNTGAGPRMPEAVHVDAAVEPGFWYVLDRAVAHRSGRAVSGPPAPVVFAEVPRHTVLTAMTESMEWHRAHEGATLYSVLNACRAWRFAGADVLGSKLEGAAWARSRWPDTGVIDAAVALRRGDDASLDPLRVDALLSHALTQLRGAADAEASWCRRDTSRA
jgi:hypothetical protein